MLFLALVGEAGLRNRRLRTRLLGCGFSEWLWCFKLVGAQPPQLRSFYQKNFPQLLPRAIRQVNLPSKGFSGSEPFDSRT